MRVIISKTLKDNYQEFVVVDSLKKVKEVNGVDVLILHDIADEDFNVGVFVAQFKEKGVNEFYYINENPRENIKAVIAGVGGKYIEDEFYLEDEEELLALLNEMDGIDSETMELMVSSKGIIDDFIKKFEDNDESIKAPLYLEQVKDAVGELAEITERQQQQIITMGNTAIETFKQASDIIKNIGDARVILEEKLTKLQEQSEKQYQQQRGQLGGNILFFPTYKYTGMPKLLLIREVSPCRYLTSFLMSYEHYLHYTKNKRVKIIFVHQKGAYVAKKYSDGFTSITPESMYMDSLYDAEVVATNNPKNEVMKKLLSKPVDVYIVVDRLYGTQSIVSGKVAELYAVSGKSDLKRFNIDAKKSIFSVNPCENNFMCIPSIKNYPPNADLRRSAYYQIMKEQFKMLDDTLQVL